MAVCSLIIVVNNVLILWGCWDGHRVTQNPSSIIIASTWVSRLGLILLIVVSLRLFKQARDNRETTWYRSFSQLRLLGSFKQAHSSLPEQK